MTGQIPDTGFPTVLFQVLVDLIRPERRSVLTEKDKLAKWIYLSLLFKNLHRLAIELKSSLSNVGLGILACPGVRDIFIRPFSIPGFQNKKQKNKKEDRYPDPFA